MTALGTTDITTTLVKNTLGSSSFSVTSLVSDVEVNKWSLYKPTRGATGDTTYYKGTDNKFGFNFAGSNPNKWDYLQPTSNYRLGDFRGYEHDKANTPPPVYADAFIKASTNGGNVQPTTSAYNVIDCDGGWVFGKNTTSGSVRILDTDLGIQNYYWGVLLTSPAPAEYWYKTLGNLNDNANLQFNLTFTNPTTVTFQDFPDNDYIGEWSWQLFISSSQQLTWSEIAPSNIIYLPTDADLPSLISSGHFHMLPYLIFGLPGGTYQVVDALPSAGGNFRYSVGNFTGTPGDDYDFGRVNTNDGGYYRVRRFESDGETSATWFNFKVYDSNNTNVVGTQNDETGTDSDYLDATYVRVFCNANTGNNRTGILKLTVSGAERRITINQAGAPPTFNHNSAHSGMSWTAGPTASNVANQDTSVYITGTVTGFYSGAGNIDMYVWIEKEGVQQGSPLVFGTRDGTAYGQWITGQSPFTADLYNIYYGTYADYMS